MSGDGVNRQRRYFLIGATSVVGGLGVVGAAVPFVASWSPSAKARALGAPITVDISRLNAGEMLGPIPAWRGQPVFILYRTPAALEQLPGVTIVTRPALSLFTFALASDAATEALLTRINDDGRVYLTQTRHKGAYVIRVQVGQFDCTQDDVRMVEQVLREFL